RLGRACGPRVGAGAARRRSVDRSAARGRAARHRRAGDRLVGVSRRSVLPALTAAAGGIRGARGRAAARHRMAGGPDLLLRRRGLAKHRLAGAPVRGLRIAAWTLVVVALALGAVIDRPITRSPLTVGGYRVLAADFHTHSSTWSDGALTPFGIVLEAKRQGLDVIAITGHNEVIDAKVGQWFSRLIGGPTVLVGEEILHEPPSAPNYHLIAVGIS